MVEVELCVHLPPSSLDSICDCKVLLILVGLLDAMAGTMIMS